MLLIDLLTPSRTATGVSATSKKRLLETLATTLAEGQGEACERAIFDSLFARERLGSTGLGHGVAIPHGRTPGLSNAIGAFVRLSDGIDFSAIDGAPVDLVFALAVPEHFSHQHLVLLSQLAEMFGDAGFCLQLRNASDAASLYALLADWQLTHAAA
ncbi:PTS IIA-like nitrogen regulatory protein PtsN [Aquimonas sp.]|jgi:PTS system nitrogen regulatory IIA component|uniref:PTS IIA-like nitrogen regulatory protein PtsN n=1 Tax=Aquimonas sp. TaxID=1872588 RepID=UPI0037BF5C3B